MPQIKQRWKRRCYSWCHRNRITRNFYSKLKSKPPGRPSRSEWSTGQQNRTGENLKTDKWWVWTKEQQRSASQQSSTWLEGLIQFFSNCYKVLKFCKISITLLPKPEKDTTKKETLNRFPMLLASCRNSPGCFVPLLGKTQPTAGWRLGPLHANSV